MTLYVGTSLDSEADRRPHHLLHQYFQNPLDEAMVALETMGFHKFSYQGTIVLGLLQGPEGQTGHHFGIQICLAIHSVDG